MEMICPDHNEPLVNDNTKQRWDRKICPVKGCTVMWYVGNKTSTPANSETRKMRTNIHELLDVIWKGGILSRNYLYAHLTKYLKREFHVGQLNLEECKKVIKLLAFYRNKLTEMARKEFENAFSG